MDQDLGVVGWVHVPQRIELVAGREQPGWQSTYKEMVIRAERMTL
jgi:hypothetical protein